jgi:L-threonylcarbamoyladenylate synthase
MKIVNDDEDGLLKAVEVLKKGGVVAHATDTCFGLAADISNKEAVRRVALIKKTSMHKPLSIVVRGIKDVRKIADVSHEQLEFIYNYLPGPYTVIVPKKSHCEYQSFERTIGVRIPRHPLSIRLVELLNNPVTTTSANTHGSEPMYSAEDVQKTFAREIFQPDIIINSGSLPKKSPSRIVNLCGEEEVWLR